MPAPPFAISVPSDRYFKDDHCANCTRPLPEVIDGLFCSAWCWETADYVRYMRRITRDGRLDDPEVKYAVRIRQAHLLAGGYKSLGRTLSAKTRQQVKDRDGGRCRVCGNPGTEVDHIDGSSPDLGNLQLLCADCHHAKTAENLVPASPENVASLRDLFVTRVLPDVPLLLADDEVQWQTSWRRLKSERKQRLVDELRDAGIDTFGLKTRAEMILERDDAAADAAFPVTEDDDSDYGPGSYFARAMDKDD